MLLSRKMKKVPLPLLSNRQSPNSTLKDPKPLKTVIRSEYPEIKRVMIKENSVKYKHQKEHKPEVEEGAEEEEAEVKAEAEEEEEVEVKEDQGPEKKGQWLNQVKVVKVNIDLEVEVNIEVEVEKADIEDKVVSIEEEEVNTVEEAEVEETDLPLLKAVIPMLKVERFRNTTRKILNLIRELITMKEIQDRNGIHMTERVVPEEERI